MKQTSSTRLDFNQIPYLAE
ncbi:unnamed protein product, partial [Rotaria magnacalcarata]